MGEKSRKYIVHNTDNEAQCDAVFGAQNLQTVNKAVKRLGALARTRFAKYIRSIQVEIRPEDRRQSLLSFGYNRRVEDSRTGTPTKQEAILQMVARDLTTLFEFAINLRTFGLTGPTRTQSPHKERM